jgi:hypothetical protein
MISEPEISTSSEEGILSIDFFLLEKYSFSFPDHQNKSVVLRSKEIYRFDPSVNLDGDQSQILD